MTTGQWAILAAILAAILVVPLLAAAWVLAVCWFSRREWQRAADNARAAYGDVFDEADPETQIRLIREFIGKSTA